MLLDRTRTSRFYWDSNQLRLVLTDQRFSMPIQCTDRTAEAEPPFSSALRSSSSDVPPSPPPPTSSLASRGASPEDRDLVDSLARLSVKFPPPADSEYDFLNSTPERQLALAVKRPPAGVSVVTGTEERRADMTAPFVYPAFSAHAAASELAQEGVRGPQQPLWSPDLSGGVTVETGAAPPPSGGGSPDKCAFCHAAVPQDQMNGHLYSHFSAKNEADD